MGIDSAPNILAAITAMTGKGGTLYFPPVDIISSNYFIISSWLKLPDNTNVAHAGQIYSYDIIQLSQAHWDGYVIPNITSRPAFSYTPGAIISGDFGADPVFYDNHPSAGNNFFGVQISHSANGHGYISDSAWNIYMRNVVIASTGTNDYMGIGFEIRGNMAGGPSDYKFETCTFTSAMAQVEGVTSTPYVYFNQVAEVKLDTLEMSQRLIAFRIATFSFASFSMHYAHIQGATQPLLTLMPYPGGGAKGNFIFNEIEQDSSAHAVYAQATPAGLGQLNVNLILSGIQGPSDNQPLLTGIRPLSLHLLGGGNRISSRESITFLGTYAIDGTFNTTAPSTNGGIGFYKVSAELGLSPNYFLYTAVPPMAAPTATVGAPASGVWPASTGSGVRFAVAPVWWNGPEGALSLPSTGVVTDGTRSVTVNWTAVQGAQGYNLYFDNTGAAPIGIPTYGNRYNTAVPGYTGTTTGAITNYTPAGISSPDGWGFGGPTIVSSAGVIATKFTTTTNTGFKQDYIAPALAANSVITGPNFASAVLASLNNAQTFSATQTFTNEILTTAAPTVAAAQIGLGSTTATTATAGANGAVPAQVAGYLIINVAGTNMKVPYFNV
jgi:hypothetical protein